MAEMIIDIGELPNIINSKISSKKVIVHENNGIITLKPFPEEKVLGFDHLFGIVTDDKISIDDFLNEKKQEIGLEI